jgi:hypothetical protein
VGKYLAVTGQRGQYDDIIVSSRNKTVKRITVKIDGLTTLSWSPDGKQLVFTGYVGGFSDLFIVVLMAPASSGSGRHYADLHRPGRPTASRSRSRPGAQAPLRGADAGNFRIGCSTSRQAGRV